MGPVPDIFSCSDSLDDSTFESLIDASWLGSLSSKLLWQFPAFNLIFNGLTFLISFSGAIDNGT